MSYNKVIGIGWDVGGWMGKNHGVAVCEWNCRTNTIQWRGKPAATSLAENSLTSLEKMVQVCDHEMNVNKDHEDTLIAIGIDAPLGYPREFTQLLQGEMPSVTKPKREIDNTLAYRATDQEIHRVFGKKPLSATFDRIGNNATVAMLHARLWEKDHGFKVYPISDQNVDDNRIMIEVYPALLKAKRFEEVFEPYREFMPAGTEVGTDAYDACICALYAIAFGTNGALLPNLAHPPKHLKERVKEEGWVYYFTDEKTRKT
ncbi:DUF429 domain-containing protein [Bacillus shivajii]|uniref:DUF429 domain-containing protein n=1 Tax=Bacillus shivajii TaxID=1983719 RepID=UPI001CF9B5C1|nr:DUF429 domain-containing protein [Bacillus shivajii]UCZ54973.1 DUF429 domain-containing protein [Bacillus shivajii]